MPRGISPLHAAGGAAIDDEAFLQNMLAIAFENLYAVLPLGVEAFAVDAENGRGEGGVCAVPRGGRGGLELLLLSVSQSLTVRARGELWHMTPPRSMRRKKKRSVAGATDRFGGGAAAHRSPFMASMRSRRAMTMGWASSLPMGVVGTGVSSTQTVRASGSFSMCATSPGRRVAT